MLLSCCVYLHLTRLKNSRDFETLYFAAVTASMELAKVKVLILHKGSMSKESFKQYVGMKDESYQDVGTGLLYAKR
jgi:hypothetical protein